MLDIAQAWAEVAARCEPLASETIALDEAYGRRLAAPGVSQVDLPPFDRSAMDGFAVRAADTAAGASLRRAGAIAAGDAADVLGGPLSAGTAVEVTTGAALPPGADAVLQLEHAETGDDGKLIRCLTPVDAGRHVRYRGEDVKRGDVLAPVFGLLNAQRLSALASAGVGQVAVHRRARVHILATGSELLELGAPPEDGRIHESNRPVLAALCARTGAEVASARTVPDDPLQTRTAVEAGLSGDVLLISGGVSVGTHDYVKPSLEACGVDEIFWRVRLRPGKPLWFGRRGSTLVFGLPGNPLSSIVCFLAFVAPALARLHGDGQAELPTRLARLTTAATASDGRTTFLSARFAMAADGVLEATPLVQQGSHLTGSLADADGFVIAPHDGGALPAGSLVRAVELA